MIELRKIFSTALSVTVTVSLLLLTPGTIRAALVEVDLVPSSGDKLLTRDTVSGLDWLDLTETANRSYVDVSSQLGPGGEFEGFRYATEAEVMNLFGQFGLPFFFQQSAGLFAGAQSFLNFFGTNLIGTACCGDRSDGLYEPPPVAGQHRRIGVFLTLTEGGVSTGQHPDTDSNQLFGSYLVRDASAPPVACVGFEPPMHNTVTVKKNRALPLKAQLFDQSNVLVTDLDLTAPPVIQVLFSSGGGPAVDVTDDALPSGQGENGNIFSFNIADNKWQYNLKTKNYTAPGTYTITMESGDDTEYVVDLTCTGIFVVN